MPKIINSMSVTRTGNKNNPPIIFIHGFPFDSTMWKNQIKCFSKSYYCISYDIRGFGESYVGDGQYTMEAYVEDLISIADVLKLEKPILCGLSMGGYIALRAVEKKQDRFGGLILCNTKASADDDKAKLARAELINLINVDGLDKFAEDFIPNCFAEEAPKDNPKAFKLVTERTKQLNPLGVKGALFAMLSRTDTTSFLKKVKLPALVISGSFDKFTPPTVMRPVAEQIAGAEFAITPRAGHLAPLENSGFVNDMINGFIKRRIIR